MKHFAALMLCLVALSPGRYLHAQVPTSARAARTLERTASTPQQFGWLATYYRQQEKTCRAEAAEQRRTLQAEQQAASAGSKYPTAEERARRLMDYFTNCADTARARASQYEKRAHTSATETAQP